MPLCGVALCAALPNLRVSLAQPQISGKMLKQEVGAAYRRQGPRSGLRVLTLCGCGPLRDEPLSAPWESGSSDRFRSRPRSVDMTRLLKE